MKILKVILMLSYILGQVDSGRISPVVPYWKTLSNEEKETFLFHI